MLSMERKYSYDDISKMIKPIDAWWCRFIMEPLTIRPTLFIANKTNIKPAHITYLSFISNITSVCFFSFGSCLFLILGAILFELSFILDCIDGKLARLTNSVSEFGGRLDYIGGVLYTNLTLPALLLSQFAFQSKFKPFLLGIIYIVISDLQHFKIINVPPLIGSPTSIQKTYVKSEKLAQIISHYYRLRQSLEQHRLAPFPSEIDSLNVILFLAPLCGCVFYGILFGVLIMSIQLVMLLLVKYDRKRSGLD